MLLRPLTDRNCASSPLDEVWLVHKINGSLGHTDGAGDTEDVSHHQSRYVHRHFHSEHASAVLTGSHSCHGPGDDAVVDYLIRWTARYSYVGWYPLEPLLHSSEADEQ